MKKMLLMKKIRFSPELIIQISLSVLWLISLYVLRDRPLLMLASTVIAAFAGIILRLINREKEADKVFMLDSYNTIKKELDAHGSWRSVPDDFLARVCYQDGSSWTTNTSGTVLVSRRWKGYYFEIRLGIQNFVSDVVLERDGNMAVFADGSRRYVHRFSLFRNGRMLCTESPE